MSHKAWIAIVILAGILALGAAVLLTRHPIVPETPLPEPVTVNELEGKSIYVSGEHGFTFVYESRLALTEGTEEIGEGKTVSFIELKDAEARLRLEIDPDTGACTGDGTAQVTVGATTWSAFVFGTDRGYETLQNEVCYRVLISGNSPALEDTFRSVGVVAP